MAEQITVKNLIEELSKQDPDALVVVEGCDCIGEVIGVTTMKNWYSKPIDDGSVIITRN